MIVCIGAFDLFHVDHLRFLKKVKKIAKEDELVKIYIVSDAAIRRFKGPNRPIIPQEQREKIISSLNLGETEIIDSYDLNERVKACPVPRVVCLGEDQTQVIIPESWKENIIIIPRGTNQSTSDIIEKIKKC